MEEYQDSDDEFLAPPYCVPIRADVRTFDWEESKIFSLNQSRSNISSPWQLNVNLM